jgi:hypothetical protein
MGATIVKKRSQQWAVPQHTTTTSHSDLAGVEKFAHEPLELEPNERKGFDLRMQDGFGYFAIQSPDDAPQTRAELILNFSQSPI